MINCVMCGKTDLEKDTIGQLNEPVMLDTEFLLYGLSC